MIYAFVTCRKLFSAYKGGDYISYCCLQLISWHYTGVPDSLHVVDITVYKLLQKNRIQDEFLCDFVL